MTIIKKQENKAIIFWFLVIIWMVIICIGSSISVLPGTESLSDSDFNLISSIVHVILYAVLTGLLINALLFSNVKPSKALIFGFLFAIFYGITDEFHQSFVINREPHISDWLLDVAGGLIVFYFYRYKLKK